MSTVDASGAIHGSDGRFAGHVSSESDVTLEQPVGPPAGSRYVTAQRSGETVYLTAKQYGDKTMLSCSIEPTPVAPGGIDDVLGRAAEDPTLSEVGVTDPEPDQQMLQRAASSARRAFDLGNAAWAVQRQQHEKSAIAAAQYVRAYYPDAATVTFRDSDEYADDRWHPRELVAADGTVLEDDLWDTAAYSDIEGVSGGLVYTEASMSPHFKASVGFGDVRLLTMNIDGVLRPDGSEYNRDTSVRRISPFVGGYLAAHGEEADKQTAVKDMLTDLHHWAKASDVDLDAAMAGASWMADEEDAEWGETT
ncbi:hypothetical protein [Branchiibius cervicis]|uniref:Uncharacterized protein n=1 Tax=Branchiibius cervicis TaxID=908252 RepID=A0ABW2ATL1_9MICO